MNRTAISEIKYFLGQDFSVLRYVVRWGSEERWMGKGSEGRWVGGLDRGRGLVDCHR